MQLKPVKTLLFAIALSCAMTLPALAQETSAATAAPSSSSWPVVTQLANMGPRQFSAERSGTFGGQKIRYRASLSEMLVKDRTGKPASSLFVTTYVARADPAKSAARPVVFIFNGGPGGSSNTLMFGAMGPERLKEFDLAAMSNPATAVVANEDAILDVADLVFIDAPETGYGRPLPGSDPAAFRSNDGDASAFVQVILRWLTDNKRLTSPIHILGESYGTVRGVLLARDLRVATPRIELTGLILVSQALWYNGPTTGNIKVVPDPIRAINSLPDIAALSWHHGLIDNRGQTLEQAVRAAQDFALKDYATVLVAGSRASQAERARIADRLAQLTGYPASQWLEGGLRLDNIRHQLLADRNLALGQFDGREIEPLQGAPKDEDRDFKSMMAGLTVATGKLATGTFGAKGLPEYRSVVDDPFGFEKSWSFIAGPAPGPDIILREQMAANPKMRLLVTQGVFDTATTMGETDYLLGQIGVPKDRTTFAYYPGGHMLYSEDAGRLAFLADVRAFVSGRTPDARPFPSPEPGQIGGKKQSAGH